MMDDSQDTAFRNMRDLEVRIATLKMLMLELEDKVENVSFTCIN